MTCNESRALLEADADGELDTARRLELEAHLRACPECSKQADAIRARREALRSALPRFAAPPRLVESIRASLEARTPAPARRSPYQLLNWNTMGLAATLALAVAGGYSWGRAHERGDALVNEAVTDHVRSLQADHLMDVVSTDQHTVKPWFIGRLDFSPPVVDLADAGFPLVGGRLEHLEGRTAAALVFKRRQHAINLFVWPADGDEVHARRAVENGYNATVWSRNGLNFLAVSEIPAAELEQFVSAYWTRTQ
jgi:anti-sigma factor RsiW